MHITKSIAAILVRQSLLGLLGLCAVQSSFAQTASANNATSYPTKAIRLIVPFAPGGVTDTSGRIVAEGLSKRLNQQVVIENKPGASGNIGAQLVSTALPDGYTLLLALDGTLVINPHAYEKVGFNALKDFAPVAKLGDSVIILVANPGQPFKTLKDMVTASKATPQGLSFGTSGNGSITHIAGELLKEKSGANLVHIAYKGGGPAAADVTAGHTPLAFSSASSVSQYIQTGKLIALGVPSAKRSIAFPDIPTFTESGVPGVELNSWVGILAPTGTPAPIIDKLNREINAVLADPAVKERLLVSGIIAAQGSPVDFEKEIQKDYALYGNVIKQAGIKVN